MEKARVMVVRRVAWRADNMVVVLIQREARRGRRGASEERSTPHAFAPHGVN